MRVGGEGHGRRHVLSATGVEAPCSLKAAEGRSAEAPVHVVGGAWVLRVEEQLVGGA